MSQIAMNLGSLLNMLQTKPGMDFVLDTWYELLEQSDWASVHRVQSRLEEDKEIWVPQYGIKYRWNGEGNYFHSPSDLLFTSRSDKLISWEKVLTNFLAFETGQDFNQSRDLDFAHVRKRLAAFSPEGFPELVESEAELYGTPLHVEFYVGHFDLKRRGRALVEREEIPEIWKWAIEKEFLTERGPGGRRQFREFNPAEMEEG